MPPTPLVVLEIDDNTPADGAPFTYDVSMWSFADDLNLRTRTAAGTFRNLLSLAGSGTFRGYPERAAAATKSLFDGFVVESEVTWLTARELAGDRRWLPTGNSEVERSLQMLFETIDVAARHFGLDRIRLVFAFV